MSNTEPITVIGQSYAFSLQVGWEQLPEINMHPPTKIGSFQVAQMVKNLPTMQKIQVWSKEDPQENGMQPTPVFLSGESHGQRSQVGYSPQGRKESDTTERVHFTSLQWFSKLLNILRRHVLFFVFGHATQFAGSYFLDRGLNPGLWHWKGALTIELPGNSLENMFCFWLCCGILVSCSGIESGALPVKAPSPNPWTTREFLKIWFLMIA